MINFLIVEDDATRAALLCKIIDDALKGIDQNESNKIEITKCFSTTTNLIKHFKPAIAIVDHELAREEDIDDEKTGYDVAALLLERFPKLQVLINTAHGADNQNGTFVFQRYFELRSKYPDRISFQEKGETIDPATAGGPGIGIIGPISKVIRSHLKITDQATNELLRLIPSRSKIMKEFLTNLGERIRAKGGMVVLQGKSQSGKTYIAERIQEVRQKLGWAPTSSTFTRINIGGGESADENLFLSDLFGHKKGSFSGAVADKVGIVQKAMHGTILLDEIAKASKTRQTLLLDLLRDGQYKRLGGNKLSQTHAFLVLATYKDIHKEYSKGTLNYDFYTRIKAFCLEVPSLQERIEDAAPIAEAILHSLNTRNSTTLYLSETTKIFLTTENSPVWHYEAGGVGELEDDVEKAFFNALNADTTQITPFHFELKSRETNRSQIYSAHNTNKSNLDSQQSEVDVGIIEKFDFIESLMIVPNYKMEQVGELFSDKYTTRKNKDSRRQAAVQWLKTDKAIKAFDSISDAIEKWPNVCKWYCRNDVKKKPMSCHGRRFPF